MNPPERMRVPNSGVWVLVLLLLFMKPCSGFGDDGSKMLSYFGVTMRIPHGVKVKKYRGVDFAVVTFIHNGEGILNTYFGNWPDIGKIKFDRRRKIGNNLLSVRRSSAGQGVNNYTLLNRGEFVFPEYFHFWYSDIPASEAKVADAIISETISLNVARR